MGLLIINFTWTCKAGGTLSLTNLSLGRKLNVHYSSPIFLPVESCNKLRTRTRVFARKKSAKKSRRKGDAQKNAIALPDNDNASDRAGLEDESLSGDASVQDNSKMSTDNLNSTMSASFPSRTSVLQACTGTSVLIAALGVTIRQWKDGLFPTALPRYHTWPDFAESSEAANQQVLSSLQPLDYLVVASLSGVSEELLFRGTMLPLFGVNWKSALVVGIVFGVLHLGSGRKYSFAVWATFIGFAYGYATVLSSSITVPMASHAANNLVGGIIWRYASKSSK